MTLENLYLKTIISKYVSSLKKAKKNKDLVLFAANLSDHTKAKEYY